ncbi:MAG TPA: lysylphosphatidylglycerol synthase domain-containing protein, partial [Planctomycetota bacterium]|nr:lysylphosphatidylglycerol synthase domain-containing protein [Planctomycetota bacterium]
MTEKRSFLARWRTPLQVLLAVAALTFVLIRIPWHDVLVLREAKGTSEVEGELRGDWKTDRVTFRPLRAEDASAPAFARLPRDADGYFALARGSAEPLTDPSFDWRPGMLRVFREMNGSALALGLGLFVLGQLVVVTRWWRLLAAGGLAVTWSEALRLSGLGIFFNLVVPGTTGGDLVKAVLAARAHPKQTHAAFV